MINYYFSTCNSDLYLPSTFTVNVYGRVHSVSAVGSGTDVYYRINSGDLTQFPLPITSTSILLLDTFVLNTGDTISFESTFNAVNSQNLPFYARVGANIDTNEITNGAGCDIYTFTITENTNLVIGILNDGLTFCF